ncbi:MFS transporter [Catellatospora citrea]|uniref:MFS transporter n=1 Tax=Catellatospora citrea TaxID=53366 RepID=A0A8J3KN04_9ACTN|nr:MFS transporter [Catellatospora citrea]RKE12167.1 putative MFS family arabinose efflux permease [Catellatospora citrea]GIF98869.1 MFS transporter [Catellatospora citrea]
MNGRSLAVRWHLHADSKRVTVSRALRTFGFGCVSVLLATRLSIAGYSAAEIGVLIAVACAGSVAGTVVMALFADRMGRRLALLVSALLMAAAGAVFAACDSYPVLLAAAFLGTISPSTNDNTPFSGVEQAVLAHHSTADNRTRVFTAYNVAAQVAGALGALAAAGLAAVSGPHAGRHAFVLYALVALLAGLVVAKMSPDAEARGRKGTASAQGAVRIPPQGRALAALSGLDAFAGGLVVQALLAWWLHERFDVPVSTLGALFFAMNMLAAAAQLAAPALTARSGLLVAMLWPHAVSNVLLLGVAFAPTFAVAACLLLVRHALSKVDVPARQAFTAAIVAPPQRVAVASMTAAARGMAVSTSPLAATALSYPPLAEFGAPLIAAALLALVYDALMLRTFGPAPWGRRSGALLSRPLPVDRAALLHGQESVAAQHERARR